MAFAADAAPRPLPPVRPEPADPAQPVQPPQVAPRGDAAEAAADPAHPALLGFLVDYLYSQGAWTPGDLQVPYGAGVAILLSELVGPEEAKTLDLKTVPPALQEQFRQAEVKNGGEVSAAYLSQLRSLAGHLPAADQPLATQLIDGMVAFQAATFQPPRLNPAAGPRRPELLKEDEVEAAATRAERAANEAWMKNLSAGDLARV
ncbi:MAG TPA: hypothetical protein VL860_02380, partial [Planctomycetota bacterium]|nr:hypothetical protein [Planctomycetota bacterium]